MRVLVGVLGLWLLWSMVRKSMPSSGGTSAGWDDALAPLSPLPAAAPPKA